MTATVSTGDTRLVVARALVASFPPFPGWQSPLCERWLELYLELCTVAAAIGDFNEQARAERERK